VASIKKTGRLVVMDGDHATCGTAAEFAALASERAFGSLRAPVVRVTAPDVPMPWSERLIELHLPSRTRLEAALARVLS
jgi:pyruvate dehydrogenase E1 component beta subunit